MRQIVVKYHSAIYVMNEDGVFLCAHENAEVDAPCCGGFDNEGNQSCGCAGQFSVYCRDCNNEDLTDEQVDSIVWRYQWDYDDNEE